MSIAEQKAALRREAKARIAGMDGALRERASSEIQGKVLELPEFKRADAVFLYLSFGSEVATLELLRDSWTAEKCVAVPFFDGAAYRLVEHAPGDKMAEGKYGIKEPTGGVPYTPDGRLLAIVPGLGFDRRGRRLGRGGGYYDRILAGLEAGGAELVSVGLTYQETLFDEVPTDAFDFDVDIVVTESESIRR